MGKTSKVVICGMKGVGKTTILEQVIYGNVTEKTVCKILNQKPIFYIFLDNTTSELDIINIFLGILSHN